MVSFAIIKGLAALTGFSYMKMIVWAFHWDKKSGRNEVTVRQGSTVSIYLMGAAHLPRLSC